MTPPEPSEVHNVTDFHLPNPTPWWARIFGMRPDWETRPYHRRRTYHSPDRSVEITIGPSGHSFALEVSRFEEYTVLHIGIPRAALFWRIAPGAVPPVGEVSTDWGVSVFEGDLVFRWGRWSHRLTLNPFRWDRYERARLRADGEWDATDH